MKTTTGDLAALLASSAGDPWYSISAPHQGKGIDLGDPLKAWSPTFDSSAPTIDDRRTQMSANLMRAGVPAKDLDNAVLWVEAFLKKQSDSDKAPRFALGDQANDGERYLFAVGAKGVTPVASLSDLSKPPEIGPVQDGPKRTSGADQDRGPNR